MLTLILSDSVHSEIFPRNIAKYNRFLFDKKNSVQYSKEIILKDVPLRFKSAH